MREPELLTARGTRINIQLAKWPGDGRTIFCIHGLTANCRCWDRIAGVLAPEHNVLAMDLRGRGLSDKPETGYSVENHCSDIESVLQDLGLESVIFLGHSLGAFIAAYFAATRPESVEKAVLLDGGGQLSQEQTAKTYQGIKASVERLGKVYPSYESYIEEIKKAPFFKKWSKYLDIYFQYESEVLNDGSVRSRVYPGAIEEEVANFGKIGIDKYYGRISCPVLIVRATEGMLGTDDLLLPEDVTKRMEREIGNARRVDIAGANHYSLIFEPFEPLDRAIREFAAS